MKFTAKNAVLAAALLGVSLIGAGQASAMPIAADATIATHGPQIEKAGWRCGPRRHVDRWGRCVWNGRRW